MLDFPDSPTVGQIFTSGGSSWHWDGVKWLSNAGGGGYLPLSGGTVSGPLTVTGATTLQGNTTVTGSSTFTASATFDAATYLTGDLQHYPLYLSNNAGYCGIEFTQQGVRSWAEGVDTSGLFHIWDVTGGFDRVHIDTTGVTTFNNYVNISGNASAYPLYLSNSGAPAWIEYTVQGVRSWASGPSTDGVFYFYDISANATRAYINTAGTFYANAGIFTQGGPSWQGYGQALAMGGSTCIHWPDTGGGVWAILQTGNNGLLFGYSPNDSSGLQWVGQLNLAGIYWQGNMVATQAWVQGSYWTAGTTNNQINNYVNAIRLAFIADLGVTWPGTSVQEPYGGGIITGWSWNGSVTAAYRFRACQYNIPNQGYLQAAYA